MITYPSKIYTETELLDLWNSFWSEVNPKVPRKDRPFVSPLSKDNPKYLIALDGDKIVGYSGWVNKPTYNVLAGSNVISEYRNQRISSNLIDKRMQLINDKPIIVSINNKNLPEGQWMAAFERRGWIKNPTDEEIPEGLPIEAVESERKRIGGEKLLVWNPNSMNKAWNVVKAISDLEANMFMFMET